MFRILVTDAEYKHSIAIQRYLRSAFGRSVSLAAHTSGRPLLPRLYRHLDRLDLGRSLEQVLRERRFDMVIPVGARSVEIVAACAADAAVLPAPESIQTCYDKASSIALAQQVGVRVPRTSVLRAASDPVDPLIAFPCVIKAARETEAKGVVYAHSTEERKEAVRRLHDRLPADRHHGILVQEYVEGVGHGFFALYAHGRPLRVFMHQRIREYPVTGGASTAARAFHDEALRDAGLRILDALAWHGVAMVEFKRSVASGEFVLMEVNGKFWGSSELALAAGVNFGADLVRVYRGEALAYSEAYDRECHFYWPLDDDVLGLWQTGQLRRIQEYRNPDAHTNLGQSLPADLLRGLRTAARIVTRRRPVDY